MVPLFHGCEWADEIQRQISEISLGQPRKSAEKLQGWWSPTCQGVDSSVCFHNNGILSPLTDHNDLLLLLIRKSKTQEVESHKSKVVLSIIISRHKQPHFLFSYLLRTLTGLQWNRRGRMGLCSENHANGWSVGKKLLINVVCFLQQA